jgi:hypothetical protein
MAGFSDLGFIEFEIEATLAGRRVIPTARGSFGAGEMARRWVLGKIHYEGALTANTTVTAPPERILK